MSILSRLKQAFVPVNQPTNFHRLYFIPETSTLPSQYLASNDSLSTVNPSQPSSIIPKKLHTEDTRGSK